MDKETWLEVWIEPIYSMYPRKVGRRAALRAIERALKRVNKRMTTAGHRHPDLDAIEYLSNKTAKFAAAVKRWPPGDRKFVPYPATWFNQDRFDDDPAEWERRVDRPRAHDDRGDRRAQSL